MEYANFVVKLIHFLPFAHCHTEFTILFRWLLEIHCVHQVEGSDLLVMWRCIEEGTFQDNECILYELHHFWYAHVAAATTEMLLLLTIPLEGGSPLMYSPEDVLKIHSTPFGAETFKFGRIQLDETMQQQLRIGGKPIYNSVCGHNKSI